MRKALKRGCRVVCVTPSRMVICVSILNEYVISSVNVQRLAAVVSIDLPTPSLAHLEESILACFAACVQDSIRSL